MATPAIAETIAGRASARSAALPCLIGGALFVVVLAVGGNLLNDADTYWHLVVGEWILANGFPTSDPFSFTFAGQPWIAKEWLSQILYLGAYRAAGWTGVVVLAAGAVAAAFGLLTRYLERSLAPIAILAFAAIAFMLVAPHALARPHVLALPVMVAWLGELVAAADRGKAPSYLLLPLMVVWANLHGGFVFGVFMVGAVGLDAVAAAARAERWKTAGGWLRFGILAVIAGCDTPYGPQSILAAFQVLSLGPALSVIGEWKPADFSHVAGLELALLAGAGFALWRGVTLPWARVLILIGLTHMALSAERNSEILALAAPLFLATPLARQIADMRATGAASPRLDRIAGIVLALLIPMTAAFANFSDYEPNARITPAGAVAALKAANVGHVLNDYDFGGYLVAAGVPTFIDGRTELYGSAFVTRYARAVSLADLNDFTTLLDTYTIGATMLRPGTPAIGLLDMLPGWQRLYADDTAVVHIRTPLRPTLP